MFEREGTQRERPGNSRLALAVLLAALAFFGCSAIRINHFRNFANAGVAYTKAVEVVLEEAGDAAIDTDSMVLEKVRPSLPKDERGKTILEHNQVLRERLSLLGDLHRHGLLLRSYFEALGALAESDRASGIGAAAEGVTESLGKLHQKIAVAKIGEVSVSSFAGKAAEIAVAHFKRAALERELKARSGTIAKELDLQRAALAAVAETMRTDLQAQLLRQESREVVIPYAGTDTLPSNWAERRRKILRTNASLASTSAAADAAGKLRISFIALVEGRFTEADLPRLIEDINQVVTLIEKIRGKSGKEG